MPLFGDAGHRCKRCHYEIEAGVDTCPRCQYSPKAKGLRVALVLLLVMVLAVTAMMIVPRAGRILIPVAGVSFLLTFVVLVISFAATPHRLGRLFLRL